LQAFPASGSLPRSKVNDAAGASTPASNFFAAVVVLFAILFLLPALSALPIPAISCIVVVAIAAIIDIHPVLVLIRLKLWGDVFLWFVIFLSTVAFGADTSIFIALGACLMLLVRSIAVIQPQVLVLGQISVSQMRQRARTVLERLDQGELNSDSDSDYSDTRNEDDDLPDASELSADNATRDDLSQASAATEAGYQSPLPVAANIPVLNLMVSAGYLDAESVAVPKPNGTASITRGRSVPLPTAVVGGAQTSATVHPSNKGPVEFVDIAEWPGICINVAS
jgi:hypothetical protein